MKKLLLGMLAIVAMVATSCQQEVDLGVNAGETATVSFNVNAPASRAYSDGTTATVLQYAVYDAADNELTALTVTDGEIHGSTTVNLQLVTGNSYTVLFWAAAPNAPYTVDFDAKTMEVNYAGALSNDEKRDAFYAKHTFTVKGAQTETIELRRPFAQLNIGTNDYLDAEKAGYVPTHSSVIVENLGNVLDLWNGDVEGTEATITFATADIKKDEEFPVSGGYEYLAMNYILVGAEKETVNVTFTYANEAGDTKTRTVGSVPVQRNYRTNLYGSILTSEVAINVEIKPEYNEPAHEAEALYLAAVNGGEVSLTEDVELESTLLVQNNMTINLNGKTITTKSQDGYAIINEGGTTLQILNGTSRTTAETGAIYGIVYTGEGSTTIIDGGTFNAVENGAYVFLNSGGNLTINNATINGGSTYPIYSYNAGNKLVINNATVNATFGCVNAYGDNSEVVINGGTFQMTGVQGKTSHIAYFSAKANVTINGGTFEKIGDLSMSATGGGGVCVNGGANLTINGGTFSGDYADVYNYGGAYSILGGNYKFNPANVVAGYKAVSAGGRYYVLPEVIANAATAENVTSVTESTADVATALTTDNGEATMFLWNDVAYIAKYGEVVITSSADEATTVRGVVEGASGLTTATVAEGIEVVGNRTFRKCATLETVTFPNSLTEIGPAVFQSCSKLANVTIPASVATIGEGAFAECTSLTSINIPEAVTRLEKDVLRNTGLTSIEIPASVTYIGTFAFRDCKQLKEVIINAPEFTIEANAFGVMAAPFTPLTIEVANAEMKAYVESKLGSNEKKYITVVAPAVIDNTADLQAALAAGQNVILANDLTISSSEMLTAPYGNKMAVSHNGGVFNGNGKTIGATIGGDNYVVMTNGGTIKDLNINNGFRGVVIMSANQTINLDNVVVGGEGVCYALNTAEGDSTQDLVATNCTFNGWSSWSLLKSAKFTNCTFGQGAYYTNVYGRLGKPYVTTLFDGCEFCSKFYIDLSALGANQVVTLKNCTVNGVKLTAENWASLIAPEDTCGEGQISVELKNGTYLTAENVADYIVIE